MGEWKRSAVSIRIRKIERGFSVWQEKISRWQNVMEQYEWDRARQTTNLNGYNDEYNAAVAAVEKIIC